MNIKVTRENKYNYIVNGVKIIAKTAKDALEEYSLIHGAGEKFYFIGR